MERGKRLQEPQTNACYSPGAELNAGNGNFGAPLGPTEAAQGLETPVVLGLSWGLSVPHPVDNSGAWPPPAVEILPLPAWLRSQAVYSWWFCQHRTALKQLFSPPCSLESLSPPLATAG